MISVVAAQAKVGLVRTTSAGNKTAKLEVSNHTALPINYASSKAQKRCRCWLSLCRIAETKLGRPNLAKKKRNNGVGANDQSRDPGSLVISHPLIAHDVTAPRSKSSEDGGEIRISILTFEPPRLWEQVYGVKPSPCRPKNPPKHPNQYSPASMAGAVRSPLEPLAIRALPQPPMAI